ncbi:MAG: redoxin domain-containing protein [Planctomycetaceae bacterium]
MIRSAWVILGGILTLPLALQGDEPFAADFSLQDYRGKTHQLDDFRESPVLVIAVLGTECPLVRLYAQKLQATAVAYADRGVRFVGLNPNRQDSVTEIAAFARTLKIDFPILKDVGNRVADQLGAERTPEVFVLNRARQIVYRGRIDDQYGIGYAREQAQSTWMIDAIEAALKNERPEKSTVAAEGCLIGRVRKVDDECDVTYSSHIAEIMNRHCVECHRSGEIAPFSLTNYEETVGWADMIREVIQDHRMPPWHANPAHGEFSNARGMTAEEKDLVRRWSLAGAPPGDLNSAPLPPEKSSGWQLGTEPDIVVSMPEPWDVPADGVVRYQYFEVDPGFEEDRWVRAAEVVPGSRDVVHHVLVFARAKGSGGRDSGAGGGAFLAAYVPGLRTEPYPDGMAKLVPAGSKLVFQMHYTPVGEPRRDQSSVGLYFADDADVRQVVMTQEATNRKFEIPPGDRNFSVESQSPKAPIPVTLLALMPHMHLRGKAFRFEADIPGQDRQTLLDVPAYDFNWQTAYRLQAPLTLPAGSRMVCTAAFDNSADNLNNPDPSASVRWGDQTWHEMMIGYFDIAIPRTGAGRVGPEVQGVLDRFDTNRDGALQRSEVPKKLLTVFDQLDSDKDGIVSALELRKLKRQTLP